MPAIMMCAVCFKEVDHVEDKYAVWQEQYQTHPRIVVHMTCAQRVRRRAKAYDFDEERTT